MTIARKHLVNDDIEASYHCTSRCVRRAFLCGFDVLTKKDFGHRRRWFRERMEFLVDSFTIDILGFGLMENHTHILCRMRPDIRNALSDEEVVRRWKRVYRGKRQRNGKPVVLSPDVVASLAANKERVARLRSRLGNLGWFMKALKEMIARRANREDQCTGHFWEGRYDSQPLLDDAAVLAGLIYVDLNPIRARVAQTPEESDFTSVQERIKADQARKRIEKLMAEAQQSLEPSPEQLELITKEIRASKGDAWLAPMERKAASEPMLAKGVQDAPKGILPLTLDQYFELVDWTGRQIREGKAGVIPQHLAPILERLDINCANWLQTVTDFGGWFHRVVGKVDSITQAAKRLGRHWFRYGNSARAFTATANST